MRGWEDVTPDEIDNLIARNLMYLTSHIQKEKAQTIKDIKKQKKSKYRANKTLEDGIMFDSKHESERYKELKILESAGKIENLKLQVPFELQPAFEFDGEKRKPIKYIADFVYTENGKMVVEDSKGCINVVYKLKRKMFEYKYKMKIKEV